MSKAIVLGGGGIVGMAWHTGVVAGLAEAGFDVSAADRLIGTSAGAVVGVRLGLGLDMARELERFERVPEASEDKVQCRDDGRHAEELTRRFLTIVAEVSAREDADQRRAQIGRRAMEAQTPSEEVYFARFAPLSDVAWPRAFSCTAVDVVSGAFVVWDAASGVNLAAAVAASCAIPLRSPPVLVQNRRYMDGSLRTFTNADLAKGHDRVLVLAPLGHLEAPGQAVGREVAALTESGAEVTLVTPDAGAASIIGMDLMNPALQYAAAQAGLRQARDEVDGLRGW
ncbi:MAG: patatin-like phospholipase family protein [Myxococcales bacterium]|nr:patatin-like phospholipase family protein [Myxococcales bacterium]MDD9971175.1 patatin-like phospholipase family protein [Myxococcales bacterium]